MLKRYCLLLGALLAVPLAAQPSADSILSRYRQRFGKVEYAGRESIEERQTDGQLVQVWSDCKVLPGRERSEIVGGSAEAYRGITQVDNGADLYITIPVEHRSYLYPSWAQQASHRQQKQAKELQERYDATVVQRESVARRATWHIRLTPKEGRSGPTVDVWIDGTEFVALRQEARSGEIVWRRRYFDRINFKPHLGGSDFDYEPPQGTRVIDMTRHQPDGPKERFEPYRLKSAYQVHQQFGIRSMEPRWVPEGYALGAFLVHPPTPGAGIFQRRVSAKYSHSGQVVMLTQGGAAPRRESSSARPEQPTEIKPGVLFWIKYGIRLLLIGPRGMDSGVLQHCARSVTWYDSGGNDGARGTGPFVDLQPSVAVRLAEVQPAEGDLLRW